MDPDTRQHILDVAQELAQHRGFHSFSYRDIAAQVGIRAPSIHYYFPSKDDLGLALIERYRQRFTRERAAIDRSASGRERLRRYAQLFRKTLADGGKMCLCGMLAAEAGSLSNAMQISIQGFFMENEAWLASVLALGKRDGSLSFSGASERQAVSVLSTLEGAMLDARASKDIAKFDDTVVVLVHNLAA